MDAITPDALVAAMVELDQEVAVLSERRRLLQQLLATFDDEHGETTEVEPAPEPAPRVVAQPKRTPGGYTKWNYDEVAAVINAARGRGENVGPALVAQYGVTLANAQKMIKQARKLGLVPPIERFVADPIERVSFDAQAARDAVAGPPIGPVRSFGLGTSKPDPKPAEPEPKYTMADAVAALENAS